MKRTTICKGLILVLLMNTLVLAQRRQPEGPEIRGSWSLGKTTWDISTKADGHLGSISIFGSTISFDIPGYEPVHFDVKDQEKWPEIVLARPELRLLSNPLAVYTQREFIDRALQNCSECEPIEPWWENPDFQEPNLEPIFIECETDPSGAIVPGIMMLAVNPSWRCKLLKIACAGASLALIFHIVNMSAVCASFLLPGPQQVATGTACALAILGFTAADLAWAGTCGAMALECGIITPPKPTPKFPVPVVTPTPNQ